MDPSNPLWEAVKPHVEFRILGPLEVVEDGEQVALGTLKERLVLGVLLLHANEFVSRDRLIDDLWGEAPPPTARKAVNVYLSKVRKALGVADTDPITTAAGGYRLNVEPEQLDSSRMQALVAEAHELVAKGESRTPPSVSRRRSRSGAARRSSASSSNRADVTRWRNSTSCGWGR